MVVIFSLKAVIKPFCFEGSSKLVLASFRSATYGRRKTDRPRYNTRFRFWVNAYVKYEVCNAMPKGNFRNVTKLNSYVFVKCLDQNYFINLIRIIVLQ